MNVRQTVEATPRGGDHALAERALQTEGVADGEGDLPDLQIFGRGDRRGDELDLLRRRNLEQCQIKVVVDGDDLDVLDDQAMKRAVRLRQPDGGPQAGLALDDMRVGDRMAVGVDEDARSNRAGRGDLDDRGPDAPGLLLGGELRKRGRGVKERLLLRLGRGLVAIGIDPDDLLHGQGDNLRTHVEPHPLLVSLEDRPLENRAALERQRVGPAGRGGQTRRTKRQNQPRNPG